VWRSFKTITRNLVGRLKNYTCYVQERIHQVEEVNVLLGMPKYYKLLANKNLIHWYISIKKKDNISACLDRQHFYSINLTYILVCWHLYFNARNAKVLWLYKLRASQDFHSKVRNVVPREWVEAHTSGKHRFSQVLFNGRLTVIVSWRKSLKWIINIVFFNTVNVTPNNLVHNSTWCLYSILKYQLSSRIAAMTS